MAPPQSRNATKGNFKGKRKNHRKMWSTPEEIQKQMNRLNMEDGEEEDSTSSSSSSSSDDSDSNSENDLDNVERKPQKPKGVSNLIEIENPNRNPKPVPSDEVQLSRREREELQKQAARERYQKLQAEGKTDQAKADLARLELIRKQREEANLKREMERKEKELSKMGTKTGAKPSSSSSFNYEAVDATSAKASNKKK